MHPDAKNTPEAPENKNKINALQDISHIPRPNLHRHASEADKTPSSRQHLVPVQHGAVPEALTRQRDSSTEDARQTRHPGRCGRNLVEVQATDVTSRIARRHHRAVICGSAARHEPRRRTPPPPITMTYRHPRERSERHVHSDGVGVAASRRRRLVRIYFGVVVEYLAAGTQPVAWVHFGIRA